MQCDKCNSPISPKSVVYKGFDLNFCSDECREEITKVNLEVDPDINDCEKWVKINSPKKNEEIHNNSYDDYHANYQNHIANTNTNTTTNITTPKKSSSKKSSSKNNTSNLKKLAFINTIFSLTIIYLYLYL